MRKSDYRRVLMYTSYDVSIFHLSVMTIGQETKVEYWIKNNSPKFSGVFSILPIEGNGKVFVVGRDVADAFAIFLAEIGVRRRQVGVSDDLPLLNMVA